MDSDAEDDRSSTSSASADVPAGVRRVEAVSRTWTRRSLIVAYLGYEA